MPSEVQLNGFMIAASGLPVNPLAGVDNKDGTLLDRPPGWAATATARLNQNTVDLSVMKRFSVGDVSAQSFAWRAPTC